MLQRGCSVNTDLLLVLVVVFIIDWWKHLLGFLVFRLYRRHSLVALLLLLLRLELVLALSGLFNVCLQASSTESLLLCLLVDVGSASR